MTSIDIGIAALRTAAVRAHEFALDHYDRLGTLLKSFMPKGLYARARNGEIPSYPGQSYSPASAFH